MKKEHVKLVGVLVASLALVGAMVIAGTAAASTKAHSSGSPLKVALLLDGSAKDGTWNQVAAEGMVAAKQKFGNKISYTVEQNVPFSTVAATIVDRLIGQGYTLFFVDSSGWENYLAPVAKAHPNIRIEECQGAVTTKNYGMYEDDIYELFYLVGEVLAGASKNGYIGQVAGYPFPAYKTQINATEMGARAVNPKATDHVIYVSSFFNATAEASATKALIAAGATAMLGGNNDPAVCETAAAAGIPCMNEDLLASYGKSTYLGSAIMYSAWAFEAVISDVLAHKSVATHLYGNDTVGSIGVTHYAAYTARDSKAVQAKVTATTAQMKSGKFHDYAGPVYSNTGKLLVPAGKWLTEAQWVGQTWYVRGVHV